MTRSILPNRRYCETISFAWGYRNYAVSFGQFEDERPSEIFISGHKSCGTEIDAVARDGAVLVSLALQHGCDVQTIAHAITRTGSGDPMTIIGAIIDSMMKENQKPCVV